MRVRVPHNAPTTYFVPGEVTSPKFARAFSQGCHGPSTSDLSTLRQGPFAAFCTPSVWPLLDQAIAEGRDYYYGDHAWFRRGKYYRVAKNAVQWQPTEADLLRAKPFRYQLHYLETAPEWEMNGSTIVICPNSTTYMARYGIDARQWAMDIAERVSMFSDRPIVIRWKANNATRPFYHDLHHAWCVIVYNSGAAVEALKSGVPIITLCPWATTISMGGTSVDTVENPYRPDNDQRMSFLWALAERQFTLPEIAAGVAWKELQRVN